MNTLPIDQFLNTIRESISKNQNLVVTAAPGAGKTTRLPPALMSITSKKILVLEPRRVAAASAAMRIAEEQALTLGQEVGYQVRYDSCLTKDTQLIFLTEALLTKKIQADPLLSDIGIIILDEFHERSIHTDLAIGLLKEIQELSRSDLKIIVMSATMDANKVSTFLNQCPIIDVPGKIFELEINYSKENQLLQLNHQFIDRCVEQIKSVYQIHHSEIQNTLVFLPGVGEIERVKEKISTWSEANHFELYTLHGTLSLEEQQNVLRPSKQKKLILSTNVAESALTIDGVNTVIDCGLAKVMNINSQTGLRALKTQRIPKSSATQRAGRAARQGPGKVFRMWNKMDEVSMPDFEIAEIHRTDLADAILLLAEQGITDFQKFSWFETPKTERIQLATNQLKKWQALTEQNQITEVGKKMSKLPTSPRLARLLIESEDIGCTEFACRIAAILSEQNIKKTDAFHSYEESDLLELTEKKLKYSNVNKSFEQLKKTIKTNNTNKKTHKELLDLLLLSSYSDRLARRRRKNDRSFILIDGKGAELSENSSVKNSNYCFAIELLEGLKSGNATMSLASQINEEQIRNYFKNQITKKTSIDLQTDKKKLYRIEQEYIDNLPLGEPSQYPVTNEESLEYLPEIALKSFDEIIKENPSLQNWKERFDYFQKQIDQQTLDQERIKQALTDACYGEKSIEAIYKKDLIYFFENTQNKDIITQFHKACPASITVPSGSQIKINYYQDKNPEIEVRLQEIFGWTETPKIMNGKIAITLSLLAPNYRPVQTTQDLTSFWKNGYVEVRKELRSRYPKHSWPDDPLNAKPEAKGRPRK